MLIASCVCVFTRACINSNVIVNVTYHTCMFTHTSKYDITGYGVRFEPRLECKFFHPVFI